MNIAFVINVFQEPIKLVLEKRELLEKFYPGSPVWIIFDGPREDSDIGGNTLVYTHRKTSNKKALWTQDYLEVLLNTTSAETLMKIDPDTHIEFPLSKVPERTCVFGSKLARGYIHGGAIGFTRSAAKKLVESGALIDKSLPDFDGMNDPLVRIAVLKCGIDALDHFEIKCPCPPEKFADFAFSHPY